MLKDLLGSVTRAKEEYRCISSVMRCPTSSVRCLIDSCITELKAQGPSRTYNESKEEEEEIPLHLFGDALLD